MKLIPPIFLALILCAVPGMSARSQEDAKATPPPLPPGPLIQKRAADMAAWSVTSKDIPAKEAKAAASSAPAGGADKTPVAVVKVTVVKTGDVRVVQRVDEKNQAWNVWCLGKLQVMAWSDGKSCAVLTPPPNKDVINPFYTDFTVSDFQGFDWINLDNYTAIEDFLGRKCIVFKQTLEIPSESPGVPPAKVPAVAYIDLDSRLPITLEQGAQVYTYEWKAPPQSKLVLPTNVQAMLDQRRKAAEQLTKKALKPF